MPAAIPFTDVERVLAVPGGAAPRRAEASQALNGAGPQLVLRDIYPRASWESRDYSFPQDYGNLVTVMLGLALFPLLPEERGMGPLSALDPQ